MQGPHSAIVKVYHHRKGIILLISRTEDKFINSQLLPETTTISTSGMDLLRGLEVFETGGPRRTISVCLVTIILLMSVVKADPDVLMEFCEDATFKASCPKDHVVMVEEARYGRMHTGKCLSTNYGSIGCSSDVLHVMDRYCSGRRTCEVNVRDLVVEGTKPCPRDLRSYLEARYTCLPVVAGDPDCCAKPSKLRLQNPTGHIASIVTEETLCGSVDCPWSIQVPKGQRVNISLYEFALPSVEEMRTVREKMPSFSKVCHVYAIIKEAAVGSALTLCAGEERHRPLFTSSTNAVQIRIFTKKKMDREAYFVLKYNAIGCPDPQKPPGGWVKRTGDKVDIGCGNPEKVWQLVCHGGRWIGEAGNCSDAVAGFKIGGVLDNILSLSPDLSIVVIVLVAMVIAFVILIVGVFCLRRKWTVSRPRQNQGRGGGSGGPGAGHPSPSHHVDVGGDVNKNNTLMNPAIHNGGQHNYFRTWELQRHQNGGRPHPPLPETGTIAAETLSHRPTQGGMAYDDGQYDVRYVEHVYESPTFHRKDVVQQDDDPAQYYELDPEAEVFTPRHLQTGGGTNGTGMIPGQSTTGTATSGGGFGTNQRCSYPGTNAHHQNVISTAGNYTS